ncbi:uncharacterized protein EI97DRAFT_387770 [Westerdykella ornata]|uniref:F-box domain-containing protein n=1 Tax=Westerdykella ornata TaxID=318751 RepID=A0A6A6J510_WESOR|nr:uncharacterized protein EI97DRAFT_387770 [Westerdykella ornata]KAF2271482.1 hypothetical protein EI97DRAFT_387770 [Westerdykella ornata]
MTINLDRLPFDILFNMSCYLELDDIFCLGRTCRPLSVLLTENTLCRMAIELHAPFSQEAKLARASIITYRQAVRSLFHRRNAFSLARPFSARVVGSGTDFLFRQGTVCLLGDTVIRVVNVRSTQTPVSINLGSLILDDPCASSTSSAWSLLYYSDGIISVLYTSNRRGSRGRIFAIRTSTEVQESSRVIQDIAIEDTSKLFVRHTSSVLYYGTHTGAGYSGYREWELRGVSLDPGFRFSSSVALPLEEFFGTDIGSTVVFEVHNKYFYALSNQTTQAVEEIDWTSFYHCIRFPINEPRPEKMEINRRIYRRQHNEGPINDSWTDLSIQFDEQTDDPVIVEARREWQNGASRQTRTFYMTKISFDEEAPDVPLLPENDVLTDALDPYDKPNYAPPQPRSPQSFHPEFGLDGSTATSRPFALTRTKFRAYNYSCNAFIDLVEDDRCCEESLTIPCLRIRVGSRRPAPLNWVPNDIATTKTLLASTDGEQYRYSPVRLWPPPASQCLCSKRLHNILSPPVARSAGGQRGNRIITGVADERTLVYMVKAAPAYGTVDEPLIGSVVLVDFSPHGIRYGPEQDSRAGAAPANSNGAQGTEMEWAWGPGLAACCQRQPC